MRILIVEDEALIAWMLADSLEGGGHDVMGPAGTMAEALALCEATPPPELALLDVNLRDGSNGVDVARAFFARWGVLSIFASGQMMEARRHGTSRSATSASPTRPRRFCAASRWRAK